jgi:tetratricopeptide (TPR) repeat protein
MAPTQPLVAKPAPDVVDMTNSSYLLELAQVHLRWNATDRAEPLLKTALEKAKDGFQKQQVISTLASLLQRKADWKGAAELYEQVIPQTTIPSERVRMSLALADVYTSLKENEKAEKLLNDIMSNNDAAQVSPYQKQEAQRNLVRLWQQQPGKLDKIVEESEKAVQAKPDDQVALDRLAEIYSTVKIDPAKAAEVYEKLVALRPNDKTLQRQLLSMYQRARNSEKAIELGNKLMASATTPDEKRMQAYTVANILMGAGKRTEAAEFLQKNLTKENAGFHDYIHMSLFYGQTGMDKEADAALEQATAMAKTKDEKGECQLQRAEALLRHQEYAKAEDLLTSISTEYKDTQNIATRANYAMDRVKRGKQALERRNAAQQQLQPGAAPAANTPPQPAPVTPPAPPKADKPAEKPAEKPADKPAEKK